jgi:septin family protein
MESHFLVSDIDPYSSISQSDYIPKYLGIDKLGPVTIICGQSNSGKSVILNNLFKHKLVHEYKPEDIYFFSKTVWGDLKYKPLFKYLANKKQKINIFDKVDFNKINEIVKG